MKNGLAANKCYMVMHQNAIGSPIDWLKIRLSIYVKIQNNAIYHFTDFEQMSRDGKKTPNKNQIKEKY